MTIQEWKDDFKDFLKWLTMPRDDYNGIIAFIDEVPDDTANRWISVKDRMPEKQTPVLVYVPPYSDEDEEYIGHVAMSYYTHSAWGGYWAGTDGNIYGAIGIVHEPTHWMPLPTPPGGKV